MHAISRNPFAEKSSGPAKLRIDGHVTHKLCDLASTALLLLGQHDVVGKKTSRENSSLYYLYHLLLYHLLLVHFTNMFGTRYKILKLLDIR